MDRLVAETEEKTQISTKIDENSRKIEEKQQNFDKIVENETVAEQEVVQNSYLNSFENMTVADIKKEEEDKKLEEFKIEKEQLLEKQYQKEEQKEPEKSENIIEKPNYDLIEENPKVVKLKKKTQKVAKPLSKKTAGIILACALGASAIICVTNTIIIDQMQSEFFQIENSYNLNLSQYLQRLTELDGTKMGTDIIETYPEEKKDAGDLGQKSNWFDRLCKFIARLFGG